MKMVKEIYTEPVIANFFSKQRVDKCKVDTEIPNRLSYNRIVLVESGTGKLVIDNNSFVIKIIPTFFGGFEHKTETTFGNIKANGYYQKILPEKKGAATVITARPHV